MLWATLLVLFSFIAGRASLGQEPAGTRSAPVSSQRAGQTTIRARSEEVLLDLIVRDKRGRTVHDLKPDEIEVFEDGVQQQISTFRLVKGDEIVALPAATSSGAGASQGATTPLDPERQIRLVSMVFERLDDNGRRLARQAAFQLVSDELRQNVYMSVFNIDQRLNVLQSFTNDRVSLRKAIELATSGSYSQFASLSQQIQRQLEAAQRSGQIEQQAGQALQAGRGSPGQAVTAFVNATADRIVLHILQNSEASGRLQQGRSSIFSLLALAAEQRSLPGRKTLVYFSEGLQVPSDLEEQFQSAISAANRANVSVYAVDARGLVTSAQNDPGTQLLTQATQATLRQLQTAGRGATPEQAKAFETAQSGIRGNVQGALDTLAQGTGGFLIADTNDLRAPMERITEDVETYYELAYLPPPREYDGSFHKISVKVLRPNVKVQSRSGYFALPPTEGSPLLPYEMPMLAALNAKPVPHAFDYHAAALRFQQGLDGANYALVMEAPLKEFDFVLDKQKDVYRAHFSLLALLKDSQGQIVQKFSQDQPLDVPPDRMDALKKSKFIFTRHLRLLPGRYTLETAVLDRENMKASARRAALVVVPGKQGVEISSLSLVRNIEQVPTDQRDSSNPLQFQGGSVVPSLGDPVERAPGTGVSLYFVVYPAAAVSDKPQLLLEFSKDGQLVARATPELPAPDETGRIAYIASSPAESFQPGDYEVRAVVRQGTSAAEEHAFFTVTP